MLYIIIFISFGYVFYQILLQKWPKRDALPFVVNLIANLSFSPLQFGLQNNILALIDILIVLGSIIWMIRTSYARAPWVAWAQVPYLAWVSFATVLQASITWLNF